MTMEPGVSSAPDANRQANHHPKRDRFGYGLNLQIVNGERMVSSRTVDPGPA